MNKINSPIILFDGYCSFCSLSVDFILKHDKEKLFRFAASESEAGRKLMQEYHLENVDSVILIYNGIAYRYSTAVLRICLMLGLPFNLFSVFLILPTFLRDWIYKWIAKNRYKWFGKNINCKVPDEKYKDRFL